MVKFKFFINLNKEEKWLNNMANQGWQLYEKSIGYTFNKIAPDNTVIKIDYRTFKSKDDFENYISLFSDFGWEHISGTKSSGKQYFKRIDEKAGDDIFSDDSSKAARYKKLCNTSLNLAVLYISSFIVFAKTGYMTLDTMLNPKLLYYTPGLWEMTGTSFWRAFLFETPFAMMRGFLGLIFLCLFILYAIFAIKARVYYKKANLNKGI